MALCNLYVRLSFGALRWCNLSNKDMKWANLKQCWRRDYLRQNFNSPRVICCSLHLEWHWKIALWWHLPIIFINIIILAWTFIWEWCVELVAVRRHRIFIHSVEQSDRWADSWAGNSGLLIILTQNTLQSSLLVFLPDLKIIVNFFSQTPGNVMSRCLFIEGERSGYTTFRSHHNRNWYLGFKRNGKVKQPHNTTESQKAARFIIYKTHLTSP